MPTLAMSTSIEAMARPLEGTVDALAFADETIAASLRAARAAGGLTQAQLAEKLGRSQTLVARAERGKLRVPADYVDAVLKACGLPADWSADDGARSMAQRVDAPSPCGAKVEAHGVDCSVETSEGFEPRDTRALQEACAECGRRRRRFHRHTEGR